MTTSSGQMRLGGLLGLAICLMAPTAVLAQDEGENPFDAIEWVVGPDTARIGDLATMPIPEGFRFTGKKGAGTFMELTENPVDGSELGILITPGDSTTSGWWVVFSYAETGYVRDDEKDKLDADAILASIREGTAQANEEREKRGWETIDISGWVREPHYDTKTNNLTWSIMAVAPSGGATVNHSVRLLGRGGVMHVDLVLDSTQLETAVPQFDAMLAGYTFNAGSRYAEWRQGDKVAQYGLTALVAGGAGAALAKSGLLGKLWKLILVAAAAGAAAFKKLFARLKGTPKEA